VNFKNIGKFFLVKPPLRVNEEVFEILKDLSFDKYILFKEHFKEPWEDEETIRKLARVLAVDQEGGRVCRIEGNFSSPLEVGKRFESTGNEEEVKLWAESIAKALKYRRLNLNLAPVVDLEDESAEEFLRERTFSKSPDVVKSCGKIFVLIHEKFGIKTCLKHFPGLKGVKVDPHLNLPIAKEVSKDNLQVFFDLIKLEKSCVMTTHLVIKSFDELPVTFSQKWIDFFRKTSNFKGVILSDDINMGALNSWELEEVILNTFASGHNLITFCGELLNLVKALFNLKKELENSKVLKEKLKESGFILRNFEDSLQF